jgi:phosphatidate cytidylyltransferase
LRRAGTAVALLALFIAALFFLPRAGVALLMALVIGLASFEWARLCALRGLYAGLYVGGMIALLVVLLVVERYSYVFIVASAFWIVAVPAWLWSGVKAQHAAALLLAGIVVLVPAALAVVVLQPLEVLLVLAVAWIADTAAYFAGRRWGRRKLAPAISPGKTWEGAVGGLVAVSAYAIILALATAAGKKGMVVFVGIAALLVVVSVLGDLFESAAKRQAGVKDSGALLPGHGGVLDRIDSATAVLPMSAFVVPLLRTPL